MFQTIFELTLKKHKLSKNKARPKAELCSMTASGTFVRPDTDEISQNNETNMTTDKTKTKTYMPNVINRPKTAIGTFQKSVTINTPKKTPRKTPQKTKTGPRTTKTAQIRPMTSMTLSMNKTFVKTGKAKKSSEINPTTTHGGTWVGTFVKTGKAKSPEINRAKEPLTSVVSKGQSLGQLYEVVEKIDSGEDSTENEIEEHTTEKFEPNEIIETHELIEFNEESEIEESESEEKSEVSETNEIADIDENLYEPCKTFESSNKIDEQNEIIDEIIEANTKLLPEVLTKKTPRNSKKPPKTPKAVKRNKWTKTASFTATKLRQRYKTINEILAMPFRKAF